ncbi:MAG: enoyl-CoA hydratase/isomerase family protein [Nisaea sp.]|uniref:enoyl-CoA hydratase/isomerase family protein n=1 Tax=Nisaea sp. TaxID=2024842 RepID=UPI001B12CA1B|nr:enoyl-CoA hydratase-related protein [Nisaea sp.]MBO6560712.1 enoyl-CoA hydratase/isomerase family protein [Nisaea sp.]
MTAPLPGPFETLTLEQPSEHVLLLTLDRPDRGNALNTQMGFDLREIFTELYRDQRGIRCIVVTGRGEKIFCAGGDLKERNNMSDETWQTQHALFEQAVRAMRDCPIPMIGAINGAAFAGGLEIALCCDFIYIAPNARFALTEVTLGIMPGAGGTQNLPRAVGVRRAKEIILTGTPFNAEQAMEWGLANKLCDAGKVVEDALATAEKIAGNAPISTRQVKKAIDVSTQLDLHNGYAFEIEAYNRMVPTEDRLEGVRAFNEKRKAEFKGK